LIINTITGKSKKQYMIENIRKTVLRINSLSKDFLDEKAVCLRRVGVPAELK